MYYIYIQNPSFTVMRCYCLPSVKVATSLRCRCGSRWWMMVMDLLFSLPGFHICFLCVFMSRIKGLVCVLVPVCYNQYTTDSGLNIKHLFLTVLRAAKSKIKVPADPVFVRAHFLVCRSFFLCPPHMIEEQREETSTLVSLLLRALIPSVRAPFSWPNYFQKTPLLNTITLGLGFNIWIVKGHTQPRAFLCWPMKIHVFVLQVKYIHSIPIAPKDLTCSRINSKVWIPKFHLNI